MKTRFGLRVPENYMKHKLALLIPVFALIVSGCQDHSQQDNNPTISPEAGTNYKTGDKVTVQAHYSADLKPDSIVYLIDSVKAATIKGDAAFLLKTDTMPLGARLITAKIYQGGKNQEVSTNIMLLPAKAPVEYTYKVVKVFPHDTSSFTEGLVYQDGYLYESSGGYLDPPPGNEKANQSSLRKEDLATGKVLQKVMVDPKAFAEGISIIDNKIIQLTYHEKIAYLYDKDTFKLLNTFPNNIGVEGWGLCSDGTKLYMDDSTNHIFFLDKNTSRQIGYIDVYDDKGPVNEINELEYIKGKLYANIWKTDTIIAIDPKTGAVLEKIDLKNLYPEDKRDPHADVLNGIAYDAKGNRIFITGKKWPHLYQVEFSPLAP